MLSGNDLKYFSSLKQKKYREKEGKFLIEGFNLIDECLLSSYKIECIIVSEELLGTDQKSIPNSIAEKKIPLHCIKKFQFKKLTETENSQGIAAVVFKKSPTHFDYNSAKLIVALDKINDPGNLGTIIRTSYWFGADPIILGSGSVDLYNSKVIRATQGAIFHLDIYEDINLFNELEQLKLKGFQVFLFDLKAEIILDKACFGEKNVFVFGNESEGISPKLLTLPFERVKIKGYSNCESLNIAVSCGIALNYFRSLE